jgi:hypothetical protein
VVAAVVAFALLCAPLFLLPALVRQRVSSAVTQRLGLRATVDGVSPSIGGLNLTGVHLRSDEGDGVQADAQVVEVKAGWLAALTSGASAVTGLHVSGVEANIDLNSPAYRQLRAKLHSGDDSASSGTHHSRRLEATRFSLTVREGKDEVLVIDGTQAELGPTEVKASASRMRVSKPGLASAAMSGVELSATREDGLRLRELHVAEATLSITTPVPNKAAAATGKPEPEDDPSDDPSPTPAAHVPVVGAVGPDKRATLQALMAKFTPGATLELKRAHIEQVTGKTRVTILTDVACQLLVLPDGALRVTGKGSAQAGGSLDVDMRVWPADLRADGRVALSALPLTLLVPVLPSVPWYEPEKSRIDAQLLIKAESPARVALDGHAELRGVNLYSERLATVPVRGISLSIAGRGHWLPVQRRLEIESGSVGLGHSKATVKGAVELASDHYAFDIDAQLPATPCTEAVRSIPGELLGDMALAQWRGTFAGHLRFQTDSRELDQTALKVDVIDHCDFQIVPVIADLSRFSRPFTHSVTEPDGSTFEMETGPGTDNWTSIESMSPYFIHAVLVHEDPGFFSHHGFSLIGIRNALVRDLHDRRFVVGASTITMQLVKNIFLHREKTLARKIQEVLLTWWTERVMEKRDILELYLNVIEYGPSIYGVRNAAKHYWNRTPAELSPGEGVFLATILPNPKHFHAYYEKKALSSSWVSNMRLNLKRMFERGAIDQQAFDYSQTELEHFHFGRENEVPVERTIPGAAAPLPYQAAATQETFDANTFGSPRAAGFD